jgi:hypothetical protein
MSNHDNLTLERLRLWRQIYTLLNELQDRLYDWYESDPAIEDLLNRLCRLPPYHQQLVLPFMTTDFPTNPVQKPCPLCQIKKWP